MRSMRIELEFAEGATDHLFERFCRSPDLDREIILGGQTADGVETITSFVYGDPDAYESIVADVESVREYDVTPSGEGFFVYLRRELGAAGTSLLNALAQDTVVVVPPMEARSDRTLRLTLVGHPADLRTVTDELSDGISAEILQVRTDATTIEPTLTERQRQALRIAWDAGYYEIPRRNGIETVARELDCAVSTASELLRRGEANVVEHALQTGP